MSTEQPTFDPIDHLAEYDKAQAVAKATPCGVPECDGELHDHIAPPSEWTHSLPDLEFDGTALVGLWTNDSKTFVSDVDIAGIWGQMTSTELRAKAVLWESYPAFLRAAADKLDALNK